MRHGTWGGMAMAAVMAVAAPATAQGVAPGAAATRTPNVEFEMMTWPEVKQALAAGKTTALVYNGGTEQRGPQNVNGGHTLLGREQVRDIALKLALGDPLPARGEKPDRSRPRVNNGITGNGRRSSPELGKQLFEMKSDYAVTQIRQLLGAPAR